MGEIISTLLTPSSYPHDWYGWVTNQMGHMIVGIILAIILAWIFGSARKGFFASVAATVGWEAFDYLTHASAQFADKASDGMFMAIGAAIGYALWAHERAPLMLAVGAVVASFVIGVSSRL